MLTELLTAIVFCIGGLAVLVKCADIMINGALVIAHRLRLSKMLIGSTLLAFGTSAPEMAVNFFAAYGGKGDIVAGNIIGSNLVNLVFGIGGAALLVPLAFNVKNLRLDYPLGVIGVLFFFIAGTFFGLHHWLIGGVMLGAFGLHLWHSLLHDDFDDEEAEADLGLARAVFFTVLGMIGLLVGGKFALDGAVDLARLLEIRETLIALTIIAIGTSAPEVVTCIQAARRGHPDIAIGNIAGSQIFNGLWVLGGSSVIAPLVYDKVIFQDLAVLLVLTLFVVLRPQGFKSVPGHRFSGLVLIGIYSMYLTWIIAREVI